MSFFEVCHSCSLQDELSWRLEIGGEVDKVLLRLVGFLFSFAPFRSERFFFFFVPKGGCLPIVSQFASSLLSIELYFG